MDQLYLTFPADVSEMYKIFVRRFGQYFKIFLVQIPVRVSLEQKPIVPWMTTQSALIKPTP